MSQSLPAFGLIETAGNYCPWMIMVHGVSQNRQLFSQQTEHFAKHYRLLLIDLPGHGQSSHIPGPYGLVEFSKAIEAVMDKQQIEAAHFWGTHLGAGAGLLLAAHKPRRFLSLTLEGPVFPGHALASVTQVLEKVRLSANEQGLDVAKQIWFEQSEWFRVIRENPEACRANQQRAMIDEFEGAPWLDKGLAGAVPPIERKLLKLRVPTLIINGEHDLPDFLDVARALNELLVDCRLASIAGAGGFPLWEFPERVNTVVSDFLFSLLPVKH